MLQAYDSGTLAEAKKKAKKMLRLRPNDLEAGAVMAHDAIISGKYDDAWRYLADARDESRFSGRFAFVEALFHIYRGQYHQAIMILHDALVQEPEMHRGRYNLAKCYERIGKFNEAIIQYNTLINRKQTGQDIYSSLFYCLGHLKANCYSTDLENDALHYLSMKNQNLDELAKYIATLLRHKYRLDDQLPSVYLQQLGQDTFLMLSLTSAVLPDEEVEKFITNMRKSLFDEFLSGRQVSTELINLAAAVASQCYLNEYVYYISPEESRVLGDLERQLNDMLSSTNWHKDGVLPFLLLLGMYKPLYRLANGERLLHYPIEQWPPVIAPIVLNTLVERAEELERARHIPSLREIDDTTSLAVREQYEENPYPRYTTFSFSESQSYVRMMQSTLWDFTPPACLQNKRINLLVAGCGTGKQCLEIAKSYKETRVLAIDLSRRSLAYAEKKAGDFKVNNIKFLHADILDLDELDEKFEIIESVGVLHHMSDPRAGWKCLRKLLVPEGMMKIALYSKMARTQVVKAWKIIKEHGWQGREDDIRSFRRRTMNDEFGDDFRDFSCNSKDFYSMSGCRDLFFHASEQQFTIPEIQSILGELELKFLGFSYLDNRARQRYGEIFPDDPAMNNMDNWHRIEEELPFIFGRMYHFWCQAV